MILSRLVLNERHRAVYHDLGNVHAMHQRIMQGFPDESHDQARSEWNVLFRVEPEARIILVQSDLLPDWSRLPEGYLEVAETKAIASLLSGLTLGQVLRFRLKANPTKRDKSTGKRIGLRRPEEQESWLHRQSTRGGFEVLELRVGSTGGVTGRQKDKPSSIQIETALFEGLLRIMEPEALREMLRKGIGRGRAYGCGLLSVAPSHSS
jgi:CRISPR system Cascade subunit CasE